METNDTNEPLPDSGEPGAGGIIRGDSFPESTEASPPEGTGDPVSETEDEAAGDEPARDETEGPARGEPSAVKGASLLFTPAAAGISLVLAAGAYALATGNVPVLWNTGYIAAAAQLLLALCVVSLCLRKERDARLARDADLVQALGALSRRSAEPLRGFPESDALAPAFGEAVQALESDLKARLSAQEADLKKEAHRELVRVRSQCESLVEKYAERLHGEKKEMEALFEELKGRHEQEKTAWQAEAELKARQLAEAESRSSRIEERASSLEEDLAGRTEECARLSKEIDRLLEEVDKLRKQNVKFFDKVAAQLHGSLQIAGKMAGDLCGKTAAAGRGASVPSGADGRSLGECASEIRGRIQRIERLVDQIVDLCRIETSTLSLVYSESDVAHLLKGCLEEVRDTASAKAIDLTFKSPKAMAGVLTDSRLLVRMVRELISNAVRFTPKGGRVSMTANIVPQHPFLIPARDASTEWLRVDLADTGEGIRPEDRERIFAAFERGGEPQFTLSDASPGLGLTLAKHYAKLLGGDILLESVPGKGSTFSLILPVKVCVTTHIA